MRKIEVFTAGCGVCDDVVANVREAACSSCEVEVRPMQEERNVQAAKRYGIERLPAIVIDGRLANCCAGSGVDLDTLKAQGLGAA